MSVGRLRMRLVFGLLVLLVILPGCQLLKDVVLLVLGLELELCKSRKLSPHSLCTHSFSIIGDPWF